MVREQHIGELLEDVRHLIAMPVPRHLLQTSMIPWNRPNVAVIGKARSLGINREAVGDESMVVVYAELGTPVSLRYLVHDHVPILPPMKVWQQHQSRVGDEQDFSTRGRVLGMLDDVGDHPVAVLAVDPKETYIRRQAGEVGQRLVDQENARLNDKNLLAQPRQTMDISHSSVGLRTATWPVYIIANQMATLQFQRKTREGWRTPRGLLH